MTFADTWHWAAFLLFVLVMLAIDLGVFNRKAHVISMKEAAIWSAVWVCLSLLFTAGLYYFRGPPTALEFITGYLIEKSLSVDNLFVFVLIFAYFKVPPAFQHGILFWGILGALIMRGIFIAAGSVLLAHFHWMMYIFGAILILSAYKMLRAGDDEMDFERNLAYRFLKRFVTTTDSMDSGKLFIKAGSRIAATPLLLVLFIVEVTDLLFAVDSIPAIFAITRDPFIVFTSNVFAILGLRSLYFLLGGLMAKFHYLKPALAGILAFVGIKMLLPEKTLSIGASLGVIAAFLLVAILASLRRSDKLKQGPGAAEAGTGEAPRP